MSKGLKKLLELVGIYQPLLTVKKKMDQRKMESAERGYHKDRIQFYKQFLKPGELVYDVGANIGNRVQVFLEIGCKVVAVEPQKACVRVLEEKFNNRIQIEAAGLGREEGEQEMYIANESTLSTLSKEFIEKHQTTKFQRNNWDKVEVIRITTLDALIKKHSIPRFCKIDVEGFETEVLSGLSQPIPQISFEYSVPELTKNIYECLEILNRLSDKYVFNYSIGESMQLALEKSLPMEQILPILQSQDFINTSFGDIYAFNQD